ncbi:hypothetical protein BpHYR1_024600 [Brachionus plicatilis]|uniref:Transmembrane protein n=1 Tax=Brachionus plicatilis TaxID=10195 RepID=A0A3M7SRI2_BRAPC|nr:hypothetical protein BpHYR1_024600 [Brachionus plicatilis]
MNNNNTTTSDNSSDSASNKKSTRTEIEIIDQKIIKCINEINTLEKKIQREWSKQMNAHLKNFYDDEADKSHNNDSNASNVNQSFSTPQQNESSEYDKRKFLLHKKLKTYEKRRQKLLYESKKEQEASKQTDSELKSDSVSDTSNAINNLGNSSDFQNSSNLGNLANQNNVQSTNILKLNTRSESFLINNAAQFKQNLNDDQSKQNILQNDEKNPLFYLNLDSNMSNIKFNNGPNNDNYQVNEDNNSNQLCMAILQQMMELKIQQEKLQSDLDSIREKNNENYQLLLKELQNTSSQISEHTSKTMFGLYKTNDQKLDELKSLFDRSLQSYNYSLNHCHRDIKETKEDVNYMKNKMEIIDKTQKIPNIETAPTNYYQLFYKLLDILLTLLTIILLAFTNMIASIKFIFLLYPRTIVIFLLAYFLLFYIVDYERLKIDHFDHLKTFDTNSSDLITRLLNSIYGPFFMIKNKIYPETSNVVS